MASKDYKVTNSSVKFGGKMYDEDLIVREDEALKLLKDGFPSGCLLPAKVEKAKTETAPTPVAEPVIEAEKAKAEDEGVGSKVKNIFKGKGSRKGK